MYALHAPNLGFNIAGPGREKNRTALKGTAKAQQGSTEAA